MYMRNSLNFVNRLNLVKFANKNYQQSVVRFTSGYRYDYDDRQRTTGSNYSKYLALIGSGSLISYYLAHKFANDDSTILAESEKKNLKNAHNLKRDDLPGYSKDDVAKHNSNENGIWVSYGCGVYDITSFVPKHPGKTKISFAAGKPIDAVWEHAKIHKTPHILHYFETFRIGNLDDENEVKQPVEISDAHNTGKTELPTYHADEVAQHNSAETGIWVTYGKGVYDITNFVPQHPGSSKIMMAAGSAIDPFWHIFQQHNTNEILSLLETFRIGNLSQEDVISTADLYDPWSFQPKRHPVLKAASLKPYNAETPPNLLVESFLTPNDFFYVRNHLPVPDIDVTSYELEVLIENTEKSITLTLDDLNKYPKYSVTATIMCGGNRRSEMEEIKHIKGLSWEQGAVGNAKWTGVRLCDVLNSMGVQMDETSHVQFEGLDMDPTSTPYGSSIPLTKALDPRGDVLLAYEMNDKPLTRDHGYPVRIIAPGIVGARNVKWLGKITVSPNESNAHWQQNDYKAFSPNTDWDTVDFTKSPAIQNMPVTSAICSPMNGENLEIQDGYITVKGYAWSGGGNDINRVDITIDGGEKWFVAELEKENKAVGPGRHWSWTLWTAKIPISTSGDFEIWAKAVDSNNNVQPENFKNIWNLRGVAGNAYHKVKVHAK